MKKCFFFLFFIGLFLLPALADYQVDGVTVNAELSETGKARVSMTMQLTFTTATSEVTIPISEVDVNKVSVGDCRFKTVRSDQGVDVVLKNKSGFLGTQTFLITYQIPEGIRQGEGADFYDLRVISSRWDHGIAGCKFQLLLTTPAKTPPEVLVKSGYYGEMTAAETELEVSETTVSGTVGKRMAYDSLELSLELPQGYFQVRSSRVPGIRVTWVFVVMAGIFLLGLLYWRRLLRSPRTGSGDPRLLLPEGVLPCQLPMVMDGVTCDVAAMILQWANLGYLTISVNRRGIVVLTRTMEMGSERSRIEQKFFRSIFGSRPRVAATSGRFRQAGERFAASSRRAMSREMFDRKGGNLFLFQLLCQLLLAVSIGYLVSQILPEGAGFTVLAVLLSILSLVYGLYVHKALTALCARRGISLKELPLMAGLPLLLVLGLVFGALLECLVGVTAIVCSGAVSAHGPRRNQRGMDAVAQARGCRTFYQKVSWQRLQILQGENRRFFQAQLPSVVALGIDRQFARRFERLPIPMPEWLSISGSAVMSASALQQKLLPIIKQLRSSFC